MSLPSYRGDIINGPEFTEEARVPNPQRLLRAYNQSASTMNLLRAFSTGGYAGLERVTQWNLDFMANTPEGHKYMDVARRVDESIQFMKVRRTPWPHTGAAVTNGYSGQAPELMSRLCPCRRATRCERCARCRRAASTTARR